MISLMAVSQVWREKKKRKRKSDGKSRVFMLAMRRSSLLHALLG
jgi:hypothetical protein